MNNIDPKLLATKDPKKLMESLSEKDKETVNKAGDAIYSKKNFANIRNDASPDSLYEVAEAIKDVMDAGTRDTFVNVTSNLVNA